MTTFTSPRCRSRSSPSRPPSTTSLHGARAPGSWSVRRIAAVLVVLLIAPGSAFAGKKEEAKALVTKATKAHKDGHFEEARVDLEAAYALDPKPELLYALGQVYAKLGKCSEASTYF